VLSFYLFSLPKNSGVAWRNLWAFALLQELKRPIIKRYPEAKNIDSFQVYLIGYWDTIPDT
jgi:hypothetical protein